MMDEIYFLTPREIYDPFILGICYQTSRVIYDASKILKHIKQELSNKNADVDIDAEVMGIFCFDNLFEPFEFNKFIYCDTDFNIDEVE
jgi:hypothetical protein